jgi:ABC-type lipoprotein release transport system permease subunit
MVMGAVGMLAGSEIRRRWRSAAVLALVVGIVGAVVLATIAGARRTDSALGRFNATSRSADVNLFAGDPTPAQLHAFGRVRGVAAMAVLRAFAIVPRGAPNLVVAATVDATFGSLVDRARVIAGRNADPSAVDETTIGEGLAALLHVGVGGHLDAASYTPAQVAIGQSGGEPGTPAGPRLRLRIVGIVRRPLDLGDLGASGGVVALTPTFNRAFSDRIGVWGVALRVRTRHGAADVGGVEAAARRIFGQSPEFSLSSLAPETEGARNAIDVLTLALWIFAGVAALAGVVAISIVLSRVISRVSSDQATLRALGLTRGQRVAMNAPPALLIALGGALLAVLGAGVVSPLFPIGVARRAEPTPGLRFDWLVLAVGVIAVTAVVLVIALLAAWRATRESSFEVAATTGRRAATVPELAARIGLAPTATNGLRMALQPGHGRTAVPVRSAFLGAVFGVVGVTAVLVFAASLDHLVATPRLSGSPWDFTVADTTSNTPCTGEDFGLARQAGVGAFAEVCYDNTIEVDGRTVAGLAFRSLRGTVDPEVVAGRVPRGPREIALGSTTMRAIGKSIGDTVHVAGPNAKLKYRIVGQVVFPTLGQGQPLADGAALTGDGNAPFFDPTNYFRYFVGRFTTGADHAAVERRLAAIPQLGRPTAPTVPVEVEHLRQIGWFPATLAVLLGGLALLAVGHALVTAVRRRQRELALLKTLGFDRRQVRATVAWQATTLGTVGLVVGIPVGLIVGRFVWGLVADGLGVSPTAAIPTLALLVTIAAVLGLVNLIAFFPARAAAQTRPAVALRAE